MKALLLPFCLFGCALAASAHPSIGERLDITDRDGRYFPNARLADMDGDSIIISHSRGVDLIRLIDLTEEWQIYFNFTTAPGEPPPGTVRPTNLPPASLRGSGFGPFVLGASRDRTLEAMDRLPPGIVLRGSEPHLRARFDARIGPIPMTLQLRYFEETLAGLYFSGRRLERAEFNRQLRRDWEEIRRLLGLHFGDSGKSYGFPDADELEPGHRAITDIWALDDCYVALDVARTDLFFLNLRLIDKRVMDGEPDPEDFPDPLSTAQEAEAETT
jgi:hypothetical protein